MKTKTNTHAWSRPVLVTLLTIACLLYQSAAVTPARAVSDSTSVLFLDTSSTPANNSFDHPTVISSLPYTKTQDTTDAATASDDPVFECISEPAQKYNTVWYKYTPSTTRSYTIDTEGSDYDTVLGVWTGERGDLTSVGCNDDTNNLQSRLQVSLTKKHTYYIEVASHSNGGGQLTLNVGTCGPRVLIWQDADPWNTTSNQQVLADNDLCAVVQPSSEMGSIDMSAYSFVMIPGDQPTSFYNNYYNHETIFTEYVEDGGVLGFSGAAWGFQKGDASYITLPGGDTQIAWRYDTSNYIMDSDHPIVAGISNPFTGNYASHGYFYGGSFSTIAEDTYGGPTLIEYILGDGRVVAYTQPLEYGYVNEAYSSNKAKQTEPRDSTGEAIDEIYSSESSQSQTSGLMLQNLILYLNRTPPPLTFNSIGSQDGWILESSENSSAGGTKNVTSTTFQLGDDKHDRQYRAFLSFDTSSLPNDAVIESAVLKIKKSGSPTGSNPFTVLGNLYASIREGWFGSSSALQLADFKATATDTRVGVFDDTPVNSWYSATLNGTGCDDINTTGLTQFRLFFSKDDNDDLTADYMKFYSGDASSWNPRLIVTYTLP